jgi:hypothetical protein
MVAQYVANTLAQEHFDAVATFEHRARLLGWGSWQVPVPVSLSLQPSDGKSIYGCQFWYAKNAACCLT